MDKKVKQINKKFDLCNKSANATYKIAMKAVADLQKIAIRLAKISEMLK